MQTRQLLFASLSVAAVGLAGCTSQARNPSSSSAPGAPSSSGTPFPTDEQGSVFSPLTSVEEYWREHPGAADERARLGTVLLNERGTGSARFDLPRAEGQDSVLVVLVCDSEAAYEITLGNEVNPDLGRTWANSCGGPQINSYSTKPHDPADPGTVPGRIQVDVPPGVSYYVTAYGVAGA